MSTLHDWQNARPLSAEVEERVVRMAKEPAAYLHVTLPVPPGINGWWEPYSIYRRGHSIASLRLTKDAVAYKRIAEREMLAARIDPVDLEEAFSDLWLELHVTSYIATLLERDADNPLKPLQDIMADMLGVDDALVRSSHGILRLDPTAPRVEIQLRGYQIWDSSGEGGPYYTVRTRVSAHGRHTEPQLVTPRRLPVERTPVHFTPIGEEKAWRLRRFSASAL